MSKSNEGKTGSPLHRIRRLLAGSAGKAVSVSVCAAALLIMFYVAKSFLAGDTPEAAFYTMYICTETGKAFRHENKMGETLPIYSPYSGKNTGMPAEACYWTPDGKPKSQATWVLLNEEVGRTGPTFCPDCGRLVVGHNPHPGPGVRPPPTHSEYSARGMVTSPTGRLSD